MESLQQPIFRRWLLRTEREFHSFCIHDAGTRWQPGDPRKSLEERYPNNDAYVAAFKKAAENLVKQRYLLPEDAATLIKQAEDNGIRQAP